MHLERIRELAELHTVDQIDLLTQNLLESRPDDVLAGGELEDEFNSLVKARTVRSMLDQGIDIHDAVRELGRIMRSAVGHERGLKGPEHTSIGKEDKA